MYKYPLEYKYLLLCHVKKAGQREMEGEECDVRTQQRYAKPLRIRVMDHRKKKKVRNRKKYDDKLQKTSPFRMR